MTFKFIGKSWPYLLAAMFVILQLWVGSHHEMWRNEIQAWLLARDTPWPWELFHAVRYEGHPALWHLILWLPSHLSWNPIWMQFIHILIATTSSWLWWKHAPLPWWVRLPLPFGYFFFFEYCVLARNYAISVLLLFLIAHRVRLGWKAGVSIGTLMALLCHSNVHSMILVMGALPWLLTFFMWNMIKNTHQARVHLKVVMVGTLLISFGLFSGIYQVIPPDDTGFATKWTTDWNEKRAQTISRYTFHAYAPVPVDRPHFFKTNIFFDDKGGLDWFTREDSHGLAIGAILLGALTLVRCPFLLLPYFTIAAGLWTFFYIKFPGGYRHHGFFILSWLALLWIANLRRTDPDLLPKWKVSLQHLIHLIVMLWSALAIWGSWNAVSRELQHPFSNGKAAGNYIRKNFDNNVIVTGDHRPPWLSTLLGHAQIPKLFYMGYGEWGSYIVWNESFRDRPSWRQIKQELLFLFEDHPDREIVFVSEMPRNYRFSGLRFTLLGEYTQTAISHEKYTLYRVTQNKDLGP